MTRLEQMMGQLLIEKELLTKEDLEQALTEQLRLGLRLGSTLVAMKLISLDSVGRVLSQQHGVPCASVADFAQCEPATLALMSAEICSEYRSFPLRMEDNILDVAMVDPQRLDLLDELCFSLGYRIQPLVAPEIQIIYHLEKRYGIPAKQPLPSFDSSASSDAAAQAERSVATAAYPPTPGGPPVDKAADKEAPEMAGREGADPLEEALSPDPMWAVFQVSEEALEGQAAELPRLVQHMIDLLRLGQTLGEVSHQVNVSQEKAISVARKLLALEILRPF